MTDLQLKATLDISAVESALKTIESRLSAASASLAKSLNITPNTTGFQQFSRASEIATLVVIKNLEQINQSLEKTGQSAQRTGQQAQTFGNQLKQGFAFAGGLVSIQSLQAGLQRLTNSISSAITEGSRLSTLSAAFETLQNNAGLNAAQSLENLRRATRGLVADIDLLEKANLATTLGLNAGQLDQLAASADKLGASLGITATQALDSLIIGLGRGSRLVLDNLGVIVKAEEAYQKYATSVGLVVSQLTEAEKTFAFQAEGIEQVERKASQLAEVKDNLGIVFQRVGVQAQNFVTDLGSVIGENENVVISTKEVIGQFEIFARAIDLRGELEIFASGLASIARTLAQDVTSSLLVASSAAANLKAILTGNFDQIENPFDAVANARELTNAQRETERVQEIERSTKALQSAIQKANDALKNQGDQSELTLEQVQALKNGLGQASRAYEEATGGVGKLSGSYKEQAKALKQLEAETFKASQDVIRGQEGAAKASTKAASAAKKAAAERERLAKQAVKELEQQEKAAQKEAESYVKDILSKVQSSERFEQIQRDLTSGLITQAEAGQQLRAEFGKTAVATDELAAANARLVEVFRSGGDISAALAAVNAAQSKLKELGGKGAEEFAVGFSEFFGRLTNNPIVEGLGDALNLDGLFGDLFGQSGLTSGQANVISQVAQSAVNIFQTALTGKSSGAKTSEILGSLFGFSGFGDTAIGSKVGEFINDAFGIGDSEATAAKKSIDKYFADLFSANRISLVVNGELKKITDLQFNGNQTGGIFDALGSRDQAAFQAFGRALEDTLGIASDLSAETGRVIANNIGGSLNNLQILAKRTGLSFEDLRQSVIDSFAAGDISAIEAATQLQGLTDIATEGIPGAVGAIDQAFSNLLASGGNGAAALDAIGDLGAEAIKKGLQAFKSKTTGKTKDGDNVIVTEANRAKVALDSIKTTATKTEDGAKSLENLRQSLLATGADATRVAQLFDVFKRVGVSSLEQLRDASDELGIQIAAGLQADGFDFGTAAQTQIEDISRKIENIPKEIVTKYRIETEVVGDRAAFDRVAGAQSFSVG